MAFSSGCFLKRSVKRETMNFFPFKIKPKNDIEGVWERYYWAASLTDSNA